MILTQTPLRVSLFGGGTDYPEWYENHGDGAVLGMAINQYCYVGVKPMPPGQLMLNADGESVPIRYRVQYSKVNDCASRGQIQHPAVRAALRHLDVDIPLEFHCFGDLPGRSGLGGSSAFCVGLLHALRTLLNKGYGAGELGWHLPRPVNVLDLAVEATYLEQKVIHETVGCQDQVLTAMGGMNLVEFHKGFAPAVTRVQAKAERIAELTNSLVLVFTGTMRDAHVMAAEQVKAAQSNSGATETEAFCTPRFALHQMATQAYEAKAVLEDESQSLSEIGRMLNEAWMLKRCVSNGLTSPTIDALYQKGLELGALGGKLLGAGGGGFMLFFVPPEGQTEFKSQISAPCVRFKVAEAGSRIIVKNGDLLM